MLTIHNTEAIRQIEAAIGYTFHDKRLLVQVLTRKTYLKIDPEVPDNEVLEFYGDTLMNYHVTNYFMSKYAHMLEDGLFFMRTVEQFTDLRSHYVCNRYLTGRVKALGLARYLRAQNRDAELRRDGEKAYADIFESLVGAIYLDSYQNDALIRAFILRQLGIEPRCAPADIEGFDYDTLTVPSELTATAPEPAVLEEPETAADLPAEETVPPAPATVSLPAETADESAELMTETVPLPVEEPPVWETPAVEIPPTEVTVDPEAPASLSMRETLAALCTSLGYEFPTYGETKPNAPNARPVAACTLKYKDAKGKLVKISLNDSGKTMAEATEKVAAKMLKKLEQQSVNPTEQTENAKSKSPRAKEDTPTKATAPADTVVPVETRSADPQPAEVVVVATVPETPAEADAPTETLPTEAMPAEETPAVRIAEPAPQASVEAVEEVAPAVGAEAPVEVDIAPALEPVTETPEAPATGSETPEVQAVKPVPKKAPAKKRTPTGKKSAKETAPVGAAEGAPAQPVAESLTESQAEDAEKVSAEIVSRPEQTTDGQTTAKSKTSPAKKKAPAKKKSVADATAEDKPAPTKKPNKPRASRAKRAAAESPTVDAPIPLEEKPTA